MHSQLSSHKSITSTLLVSEHADKMAVLKAMPESAYIHLATHGSSDGVFLAGSTKEDGRLRMAEVQQRGLRCSKLVVLSECDSFKGKLGSDGVVWISRAFMAAGAPTLIASLWKIDDAATRVLMRRFYEGYLGQARGNAALALQGAMVSMAREDGGEQFSVMQWASFVVYGLASSKL